MEQSLVIGGALVVLALLAVVGVNFKRNKKKKFLDPQKKLSVELIEKEDISHDVRRFRFALPDPNSVLGLPVGKYIIISATIDGKPVSRSYTPVSSDDDVGFFDCVIKIYADPARPGVMTQYLDSLKLGDTISVRGPTGRIEYTGNGTFEHSSATAPTQIIKTNHIGMICGGTGITPMLQVVRDIFKNDDNTRVSLLFANQTEDDILLRQELEQYQSKFSQNFKVWYTVDRPPRDGWNYSTGFINEQMIRDHLPIGPDAFFLLCGPPPMVKFACLPNLEKCGVKESNILIF
eukprot:CAMPEP_0175143292 /NCGR_PEP_ID=MMETSP0087-20121206/13342_1 /TAXON_ID=136419 /ORGANISM="Unknown Unknown, Strain D1" /LENGTH=290 /DNA_ID=CAMNT_0016427327 /DNA_START=29 /DNA_END=901 /DNA_ORIENTATION=-